MQDYITSNLTALSQNGSALDSNEKSAYRADVYTKAAEIGHQIDVLSDKNESLTEFLLTTDDNNALKQYMAKVNSNLSDNDNTFNQKYQTKLQTRATYAFDNLSENLKIASELPGGQPYDLNTVLPNNLGNSVSLYAISGDTTSTLANKNYKYINEDTNGAIPYFN
jgi:hypothetical protein